MNINRMMKRKGKSLTGRNPPVVLKSRKERSKEEKRKEGRKGGRREGRRKEERKEGKE